MSLNPQVKNMKILFDKLSEYRFVLIHIVFLLSGYTILHFLGVVNQVPNNYTIIKWDVGWFDSIRNSGYLFSNNSQSNVASFPLFPYLWKITGFTLIGISILNYLFFLTGIIIICNTFHLKQYELLLMLSLPSAFFFYIPYSESLFFLFGSVLLSGYVKKNSYMIMIGLFLCSLTRAVSLTFIPAIFLVEIFSNDINKHGLIKTLKFSLLYFSIVVIGIALVAFIQFKQTGIWFAFSKAQVFWAHHFQIPEFPLTTWDNWRLIWLDGTAFWVCILALIILIIKFVKQIISAKNEVKYSNKAYLFSLVYLSFFVFYSLFYCGKDPNGGTTLICLNRYIFATPFFIIFFIDFIQSDNFSKIKYWGFLIFNILFWFLFGLYKPFNGWSMVSTLIYFLIISAYLQVVLMFNSKNFIEKWWLGIYCLNLFLQIYLFNVFLNNIWVG